MSNQSFKALITCVVLLFSLMLAACQPIQPSSATQITTRAATISQEGTNKTIVQRIYEEAFNQKNLAFFGEVFDAKVVVYDLDYGANGLDPALLLAGFPDLQVTVDRIVVEGEMVTTMITFHGTHQGEFLGVAPTGKPMTISMMDLFRFQNGKVVELWHYVPVVDILEQIGASTQTAAEQANLAVAQRFYDEVFTQKKMEVLAEVFDANLVIHDLDVGGELPGGTLPGTLAAFPDVVATINFWVVENDLVTAYVTYNGTHQAEFLGVPATGKAVTWSIIDIFRVKDGKVVELWHNIPNEDILEQIAPQDQ